MNKVSIDSLRSDTYINQPVFLDDRFILLSPDVAVTDKLIVRLKKWNYSHVQTDGTPYEGNPLGESQNNTATLELSAKESEEKKHSQDFFVSCIKFLEKYYSNFRELNVLPTLSISEKVKEIISELKEHKHQLLSVEPEMNSNETYIIIHSIKTTFLVLSIADFLKFPAHKQIEIGIAAMLHKLGMLLLPSQLYKKSAAL
ncbi:MAG: metal-dependent phosphohydrolase, partial [Spirochaetales bacterium]|nr:metal-dependent phosphohydrolase [Spirochaetales bacterium]